MEIKDLGLVDYHEALRIQYDIADTLKQNGGQGVCLILEHPPVITLGANKKLNMVHFTPPGVEAVQTKRGGGATAHNPGQLVLYPVVNLKALKLSVKDFVAAVLGMGAELLKHLGVPAEVRMDALGLWVGDRKIASMGIHVSRYVTAHGIAINLNNDLSIFQAMTPCGLHGVAMTSAAVERGEPVDMAEAKAYLARSITERWPS